MIFKPKFITNLPDFYNISVVFSTHLQFFSLELKNLIRYIYDQKYSLFLLNNICEIIPASINILDIKIIKNLQIVRCVEVSSFKGTIYFENKIYLQFYFLFSVLLI